MDFLSVADRSERMSQIRSKDTKPELRVRRVLHHGGYRYRLHNKALPGAPDIVFLGRKKVVFVHGCFWHAHEGCKVANQPKSHQSFWEAKFRNNKARDRTNEKLLLHAGWQVLIVWECETKDEDLLLERLRSFLGPCCMSRVSGARSSNDGMIA